MEFTGLEEFVVHGAISNGVGTVVPPISTGRLRLFLRRARGHQTHEPIKPSVVYAMPVVARDTKKEASLPKSTSTKSKKRSVHYRHPCRVYPTVPKMKEEGPNFVDTDYSRLSYVRDNALRRGCATHSLKELRARIKEEHAAQEESGSSKDLPGSFTGNPVFLSLCYSFLDGLLFFIIV